MARKIPDKWRIILEITQGYTAVLLNQGCRPDVHIFLVFVHEWVSDLLAPTAFAQDMGIDHPVFDLFLCFCVFQFGNLLFRGEGGGVLVPSY
mmetsp:Transcript_13301/g.27021  ORF Transcript_13301/g.27021 Transcript_13301/m.27021 type:complete len:92 (+) Transcript_13301:163-438(+)